MCFHFCCGCFRPILPRYYGDSFTPKLSGCWLRGLASCNGVRQLIRYNRQISFDQVTHRNVENMSCQNTWHNSIIFDQALCLNRCKPSWFIPTAVYSCLHACTAMASCLDVNSLKIIHLHGHFAGWAQGTCYTEPASKKKGTSFLSHYLDSGLAQQNKTQNNIYTQHRFPTPGSPTAKRAWIQRYLY